MTILALVRALGVQWSRTEQERRLFPLCVHVQSALRARYGDAYTTADVSQVPEAYQDDAKEIIAIEVLSETC